MIRLEVGKFYKARSGRVSRIDHYLSNRGRYVDHRGYEFLINGRVKVFRRFPADLVEEVSSLEEVNHGNVIFLERRVAAPRSRKYNHM